MWLVKCVKSLVSEDRATDNVLNSLENYKTALPSFFFSLLQKLIWTMFVLVYLKS